MSMTTIATDEKAIQKAKRLRKEIRSWLKGIGDVEFLRAVRLMVRNKATSWDELPEHVKQGIEEGLQDIAEGRVYTNEEVFGEIDEWLKKP